MSDVTIVVFDSKGSIVRHLDLGFSSLLGSIDSKGKGGLRIGTAETISGESVATGVYFYKLETGKISDLKKMIVIR